MLVRHFNKPRTAPYLRITVGTEDDTRRLIAAAADTLVLFYGRYGEPLKTIGIVRGAADCYDQVDLAADEATASRAWLKVEAQDQAPVTL